MKEELQAEPENGESLAGGFRFSLVFLAVLVIVLLSVGTINLLVNPYGDYASRWFRPLVQMSRIEKAKLLQEGTSEIAGMILGSSRVMQISPSMLEEKIGIKFINLGVNSGATTDFLALKRMYERDFKRSPRCCLVGIDIESFSNQRSIDTRLLSSKELAPLIADRITLWDRAQQYNNLLSLDQLSSSAKALNYNLKNSFPADQTVIQKDGTAKYIRHEKQLANGSFDLADALKKNKSRHLLRFKNFGELSERRLAEFKELAKECANSNTKLIVFLTPYHPDLIIGLESETDFVQIRKELLAEFAKLQQEFDFAFLDLSELKYFDGDASDFLDCVHYLSKNSELIVESICRVAGTH